MSGRQSLIYRFDEFGRHITTESGTTGEDLLSFAYVGTTGLISRISSTMSDLRLDIIRDSSNRATQLQSLFGDKSELFYDGNGFLKAVYDPEGVDHSMTYYTGAGEEGLLATFSNQATGQWGFEYDSLGRLTRDVSADGLDQRLVRDECGAGLSCGPGETGWRVTHQFHDGSGMPTSWQTRVHEVIQAGGISHRSIQTPLGVLSVSDQGELDRSPLETSDGDEVPITLHHESTQGIVVDVGTAADPRPGLDPYVRAARMLRPAAMDPIPPSSPARTDVAIRRTVTPSSPATLLDVTEVMEAVEVTGMTDGVAVTRTGAEWSYERTSPVGWCTGHYRSVTSFEGYQTQACIDAHGRLTELRAPGLDPLNLWYDPNSGRLAQVGRGARTTAIDYESPVTTVEQWWPGRLRVLDGAVETERLEMNRDPQGYLTSITHEHVLLSTSATMGLSFDGFGRLTNVQTPSGRDHGFTLTDHFATETYAPPAVGSAQPGVLNVPLFDPAHRPEQIDVRDGATVQDTIDYVYDATYGYLSNVLLPGSRSLDIVRNAATAPAAADGEISRLTIDSQHVDFTYDGPLLASETWSGAAVGGYVSRTWDSFGQIDELDVDGTIVDYDYDDDGRVIQAGALAVTTTLEPSPSPHWERQTTLSGTVGTSATEVLDRNGELDLYTVEVGGSVYYSYDVTARDYVGRELSRVETLGTTTESFDYTYDGEGRLERVELGGSPVAEYTYDANGNRETATYSGAWAVSSRPSILASNTTYDEQDRLTHYGCSQEYSTEGTLYRRGCSSFVCNPFSGCSPTTVYTTYTYDLLGNLLLVGLPDGRRIRYSVDGLGRRIRREIQQQNFFGSWTTTEEQRYLYGDGLNPVAELDSSNTLQRVFVYGTRPNVPDYVYEVASGDVFRVISDPRGSIRSVVDVDTGTEVQQMTYDAFGFVVDETIDPSFDRLPFGFAGGLYDPLTRLVRFGARDYDPTTGRWTAKDPSGFAGEQNNLYAYAHLDPINFVDITGEVPFVIILVPFVEPFVPVIVGAIVGGVGAAGGELISQLWRASSQSGDGGCAGSMGPPGGGARGGAFSRVDWGNVGTAGLYGAAFGGAYAGVTGLTGAAIAGREWQVSTNLRFAPFGNRTGHPTGRFPHYHRRVVGRNGQTVPGGSIKRHRPWDSRQTDTSWRDRF